MEDLQKDAVPKKKKNYNAKSQNFPIRFSHEEIAAFKKEAAELNIKPSRLIRAKIQNGTVRVIYVDITQSKLIFELNKVGVNLNQIAHRINENRVDSRLFEAEIRATIKEIRQLLTQIKEANSNK